MLIVLETIIPAAVIFAYIRHKDSYWKEKPRKLIFGVVGLIMGLMIFDSVTDVLWDWSFFDLFECPFSEDSRLYLLCHCFVTVATPEEFLKFLVLIVMTWKHPAFSHRFDGIVFSAMSSLGFATLENFTYMLKDEENLIVAIMRAVSSMPCHVAFGVLMGLFYAKAKEASLQHQKHLVFRNFLLALVIPILMHGLYNFTALSESFLVSFCLGLIITLEEIAIAIYIIRKQAKDNPAFVTESLDIPQTL